jgi:flagellar protein FliO/FliZ
MEYMEYLNTFLALVFVLAAMGLLALLAKKMGLSQTGGFSKNRRLRMIEALPLDHKHKAVLLQCDDKQHLVILSANGETVIETNIEPHATQGQKDRKDAPPFE